MTRLQKKCLIAAAGTHLLLVVVLLCSGFIRPKPKVDDSQVLDVIPDKAIDQALQSGVRNATPPPPTPVVQPPPPQPEPPKPMEHVEPPKPVEPVTPPKTEEPPVTKPELPEPKPKPDHKVVPNLTPTMRKSPTETDNSAAEAKAAAKRAKEAREKLIKSALNNIEKHASSATTVDMPGSSTVAYANYANIVKTVYTQAWRTPDDAANDDANVKVSVTIARDGQVIEAHIIERSGDASMDQSVQNTLDRVTNIEPFPDDSTDKQRTYIINFNLKAKRMLG